jgi:5-oxopent-3-ene-1,2,5-tricarboxylate decarboxylase/2-hydroxyhepta-2,4-diene-1,7-dioate isomerase
VPGDEKSRSTRRAAPPPPPRAGVPPIPFEVAPFRLSGRVYGTLLNHRTALAALGDAVDGPPYGAPPRAPVLYVKPRNALALGGEPVCVPAEFPELEAAACLGLVIGRTACRVGERDALDHVAGYLIVNDVSVPHAAYHRPSIRFKARDGFCPLGPAVADRGRVGDPDALEVRTFVDGALLQTMNTADCIRNAAQLLAAVTDFMTLWPGDVLALGAAAPAPRVRAGQAVRIEIDGIGALTNPFVADAA